MTQRIPLLLTLALLLQTCALAQTFDVVQSARTGAADYSTNGRWGQTFVATKDGPLVGIRLVVTGRRTNASSPYGSPFTVRLHRVADGIIQDPPVATGNVSRDRLALEHPVQVDAYFAQPYTQTAGEILAFTVDAAHGGMNGWNDYALSNANPYSDGAKFDDYSPVAPPEFKPAIDLTFSTLTAPPAFADQTLELRQQETGSFVITLPHAQAGNYYRLMESFDLQSWHPMTTQPGNNGPLSWTNLQAAQPKVFYRVFRF